MIFAFIFVAAYALPRCCAEITSSTFGWIAEHGGERREVRRYTLQNAHHARVDVLDYGATVAAILVPDRQGQMRDVTLGFDDMDESEVRVLALEDADTTLLLILVATNCTRVWEGHVEGERLTLSYLSADGEEGYPGQVLAHVTYWLSEMNELHVQPPNPRRSTSLTTPTSTLQDTVVHPASGRVLEIFSDQAGVQFYTSNFLPSDDRGLKGKDGAGYKKHGAFCLETQNYPDAPTFPNSILYPGEIYTHKMKLHSPSYGMNVVDVQEHKLSSSVLHILPPVFRTGNMGHRSSTEEMLMPRLFRSNFTLVEEVYKSTQVGAETHQVGIFILLNIAVMEQI
ncbi:hypothetical protein B566_EDAN008963 [Ephemera danica]|nr:hypothetical protein B566_EDAN008963 [Ephemera danica]